MYVYVRRLLGTSSAECQGIEEEKVAAALQPEEERDGGGEGEASWGGHCRDVYPDRARVCARIKERPRRRGKQKTLE